MERMAHHKLKRGLDLPISGVPADALDDAPVPSRVAILADDYPGMKPGMHVQVGDAVRLGQLLFEDKKDAAIRFTAPGSGTVIAIHRGAKRALQSVVLRLDARDRGDGEDGVAFASYTGRHPSSLDRGEVRALLQESGLWTALRARPFGRVASPAVTPRSIFVTALDTRPLAPDLRKSWDGRESDCERGLHALARLTDGPVFLCRAPGSPIAAPQGPQFRVEDFAGPHPAGLPGSHIHVLDPAGRERVVWYVGLQDVLAIGKLFGTGKLDVRRVIALGGPSVKRPRHLRTRIGAAVDDLLTGELRTGPSGNGSATTTTPHGGPPLPAHRVVSGSVLSGRVARGEVLGYLGRYDQQISALPEDTSRKFLGWLAPGADDFSVTNLFLSKLVPGKRFDLTTSTHGSPRAIVPIGLYEKVMPLDLMPTFLLKALVVGDVERAEELGCLELEEEDLSLCTFVCPGKTDYGSHLRRVLTTIEKEG
jgi:Na+-transporting NADH:ubiquinone oxidoreductase subunit A